MRHSLSGRADGAALALSLVLGAAALLPGLLLRAEAGWDRSEALANGSVAVVEETDPVAGPLAAASGARGIVATSVFRTDPARVPGPLPDPAAPAPPSTVRDLTGRVADGRLYLRWRSAPDSTTTEFRIEGLGGPGITELSLPSEKESVEIPVPGSAGTVLVRALPAGGSDRHAEARVSIPFRIPVEAVRAGAASAATGNALVVLRRPYDGRTVEGVFPLHEMDPVAGLSTAGTAGPGTHGPVVDFRTDFILEKVRAVVAPGSPDPVPSFGPDGRVLRDADGAVIPSPHRPAPVATLEVVLRGPDDARLVIPVAEPEAPPAPPVPPEDR